MPSSSPPACWRRRRRPAARPGPRGAPHLPRLPEPRGAVEGVRPADERRLGLRHHPHGHLSGAGSARAAAGAPSGGVYRLRRPVPARPASSLVVHPERYRCKCGGKPAQGVLVFRRRGRRGEGVIHGKAEKRAAEPDFFHCRAGSGGRHSGGPYRLCGAHHGYCCAHCLGAAAVAGSRGAVHPGEREH